MAVCVLVNDTDSLNRIASLFVATTDQVVLHRQVAGLCVVYVGIPTSQLSCRWFAGRSKVAYESSTLCVRWCLEAVGVSNVSRIEPECLSERTQRQNPSGRLRVYPQIVGDVPEFIVRLSSYRQTLVEVSSVFLQTLFEVSSVFLQTLGEVSSVFLQTLGEVSSVFLQALGESVISRWIPNAKKFSTCPLSRRQRQLMFVRESV